MSRSQRHLFSSRADIFCEMAAVAGGGLGLQQLQPPAAPVAETVPKLTVVSWKFVMIDSLQHVEWTVKCEGMKGIFINYPMLYLYRGSSWRPLIKQPLFIISDVDGQYTFQTPFDQNELDKNRHELKFWCVAVALMTPFCDLPLPICHNPTGCMPDKAINITLRPGKRFLCCK
jgi:hypothetical protein